MTAAASTAPAAPGAAIPAVAFHAAVRTLLDELLFQAPAGGSWVIDRGAPGFIAELRAIPAERASRTLIPGRATIAGHAAHVRFFLALFNAWARGEDPWPTADWAGSWSKQQVTDAEWAALLDDLAREADAWRHSAAGHADEAAVTTYLGSIAHVAYHLGALRQLLAF